MSGAAGVSGAPSGPLGSIGTGNLVSGLDGASGEDAGVGGAGDGNSSEAGTTPQAGPETSYGTVPGPGITVLLVALGVLVFIVRRRLQ